MKLRVWAEFITPREAADPAVVALLRRYQAHPCLAVPHGKLGEDYARFVRAYGEAGLEPALWPTLSDESGYWPNERNAAEFFQYVRRIFEWADEEKLSIPWLVVDLETPLYQWQEIDGAKGLKKARTALRVFRSNRNRERFAEAVQIYRELQAFVNSRGCRTLVPVMPFIELDLRQQATKLQDYLEAPVTPIPWDVVTVMQYNSLFSGMSKGLLRLKEAPYYLYLLCRNMKEHFGGRAALSVGLTSTGKLGNEPYYRHPEEMQPDIAAGLAAGIDDIAVFCLEGILKHNRPESWFEMIRGTAPAVPPRSRRVERLRKLGRLLYRLAR
ncbi:MAG: hypothetical protein WBH65_07475 [Dethiobacteria bacterium]